MAGSAAMISLGLRADPKVVETRESYTDQILTGLFTMASGGSSLGTALATAALESAAGRIARAMASATTHHPAITPALLHDITHKTIVTGFAIYDLAVDSTRGLRFVPAASCDITGGADPESWLYRLTINGPSQAVSITRPRAGVAHFQWQQHPLYPWKSLGPVQLAAQTGGLLGRLEEALSDEAGGPRGSLVPLPEGVSSSAELKADLTSLRGRVALPESTSGGWGDRGAAPMRDWRVERLGADPPEALVKLREDIERAVLAACGVPAGIVSTISDGTHARESFRQFVALTVKPLALILAGTFEEVLGQPVAFSFDELASTDIQGRARGWRALVGKSAEMDVALANRIVGFE